MFSQCDLSLYVVGFVFLVIVGTCVVVCVILCAVVKTSVEDMSNILLYAGSWLHVGCLTMVFFFNYIYILRVTLS